MSKTKKANPTRGLELSMILFFLMLFLVVADQFVKYAIDYSMEYQSTIPVIANFFSLHYVRNTGSAFSLFADKAWGISLLTGISAVLGGLVVILMVVACAKRLKLLAFAFSLIAAGAFGNLIDRVRFKYVIDYLRFDFGNYTFPIFNLADICAVVGTFLLMGIILFGKKYFDNFWSSIADKKAKKEKARKAEISAKPEKKQEPAEKEETEEVQDTEEPEDHEEDESDEEPVDEIADNEPDLAIPSNVRPGNLAKFDGED